MRGYVLVNESTHAELTADLLVRFAAALQSQQVDLSDWWERHPLLVSVANSTKDVPTDAGLVICSLVDELLEPDALAYHTVDSHGRPRIYIGVNVVLANGGGLDGISSALSHELCETTVDPYCSFQVDLPDGVHETPIEACDWVQGDEYRIGDVMVSNFVGPRAFDAAGRDGPFDKMNLLTGPFQLRPGGYWSIREGGPHGQWTSVFGASISSGGMPQWQRTAKTKFGTRRSKRWAK